MTLMITPAHGEAFTLADWAAMPDDGRRYELVGGTIVVTPPPLVPHQRGSRQLQRLLEEAAPPEVEVFNAPIGLRLPGDQMLEPDLVVVPTSSATDERYLHLPVLLVVEIVSRGSRLHDTVTKRAVYAEAGIEHYWLVDTTTSPVRFTALRLAEGGYETAVESAGEVAVDAPLAVRFRVPALFRAPGGA